MTSLAVIITWCMDEICACNDQECRDERVCSQAFHRNNRLVLISRPVSGDPIENGPDTPTLRRSAVPTFVGFRTMVAYYDGNWRKDGIQRVRDRREWHLPARNGGGSRACRSFLSRVSGHLLYVAETDGSRRVSWLSSDCA